MVSDISETGARIDVQDTKVIPDHFVLMLIEQRRRAALLPRVWSKPTQLGVIFERSLADAAKATLAPQADADAQAEQAAEPPTT